LTSTFGGYGRSLGSEHEQMMGTVRNVGYKFVRPGRAALGMATPPG
jgi:hypothetical protein